MKRVTRKSFGELTKRQQRARLAAAKILEKYSRINRKSHEPIDNNTTNANDNQRNREMHVENSAEHVVEIHVYTECLDQSNRNSEPLNNQEYCNTEVINVNVVNKDLTEGVEIHSAQNFKNLLRQCCLDMDINHIQTKGILKVLSTHPCFTGLPKDSRTLLKTGRNNVSFLPIGNGVYWHIGFLRTLTQHVSLFTNLPSVLEIEINTDGLSLTKSNPSTYWPIQYRVINIEGFKPLIAGIYKGSEKPSDPALFFQSFIDEVMEGRLSGGIVVGNRRISFIFKRFVADAPARALMLNHYGHNAKNPCSKCKVIGKKFENRIMVYLGTNHARRTDDEYINDIDDNHQKGESPLAKLDIPLVTGSVFDVMHLVYLGVTVRFLNAWTKGQFGYSAKLPIFSSNELYSRYEQLEKVCPNDFSRRPRKLDKYSNFKATELRHFTLYAGPVVLYGILPDEHYFHFLFLHIAMRILTSPNRNANQFNIADAALRVLVENAPSLYTPAFVSYNVHCLQHLVEDAREFRSLDKCAAFVYENNMPLFKKHIRNHPRPLQQFANRLNEKSNIQHLPHEQPDTTVSGMHTDGPEPENLDGLHYTQHKKYASSKLNFTLDDRNCYCTMEDGSVCKIENILLIDENAFALIRKFKHVEDFFVKPLKSSSVGIYKCKHLLRKLHLMAMNNISSKCYCMPSWKPSFSNTKVSEKKENEYIIMTLLHTEKP